MYYEEKFDIGILWFRSTPHGDWHTVAFDKVTERMVKAEAALRAKEAEAVSPLEVWEVYSKTTNALFATEGDARAYLSQQPASVSGGMKISLRLVLRNSGPLVP